MTKLKTSTTIWKKTAFLTYSARNNERQTEKRTGIWKFADV